jgi:hypothetical protein
VSVSGGVYLMLMVVGLWVAALLEECRQKADPERLPWYTRDAIKARARRLARGATDYTWLPGEAEREAAKGWFADEHVVFCLAWKRRQERQARA